MARTWLVSMSESACAARLAEARVGRLGVVVDGRPEVYPVCHVYADGFVHVMTNEGTKMVGALAWPWVGFEVDGVDPGGATAWSVMVSGHAEEVTDAAEIASLVARPRLSFRVDGEARWVRIVPSKVTGRQITIA